MFVQFALTAVLILVLFMPIYLIIRHSITVRMRQRQDPAEIKRHILELEIALRYKKEMLEDMDKQVDLTQDIAVAELKLARLRKKLADVQAAKLGG